MGADLARCGRGWRASGLVGGRYVHLLAGDVKSGPSFPLDVLLGETSGQRGDPSDDGADDVREAHLERLMRLVEIDPLLELMGQLNPAIAEVTLDERLEEWMVVSPFLDRLETAARLRCLP
jgi:hypothetical protein